MNEPKDKYDKVLKFIELAVLSPKKVRYRDAMSSKHSNPLNTDRIFNTTTLKVNF